MRIFDFLIRYLEQMNQFYEQNKGIFLEKIKDHFGNFRKEIDDRKQQYLGFAKKVLALAAWTIFILLVGFAGGAFGGSYFYFKGQNFLYDLKNEILQNRPPQITKVIDKTTYLPQTSQEEATINVVKEASPSVVTINITKEVPVYEQYYATTPFDQSPFGDFFQVQIPKIRQKGTEKKKVGTGTGFIISKDGLILTNKHVVGDKEAEYTVAMSDQRLYSAKVLALDPFNDIAIVKIERDKVIGDSGELKVQDFPYLTLGDSEKIQIGQTVIAIGNPLGEFQNTVSVGVISGLGRSITASGGGVTETIDDVIQTDAAINKGNSGGPLLNLKGEVIGINTAMVEGAESLGFATPINGAKKDVDSFRNTGKIRYPFLGIRYVMITPEIRQEKGFSVNYGAWISKGSNAEDVAIVAGSAAEKAGLKENDIILEINGQKIDSDNKLSRVIQKYSPGETVVMKIMRGKETLNISVVLGEKTSE